MDTSYSFFFSGANGNMERALAVLGGACYRAYRFGVLEIAIEDGTRSFVWDKEKRGAIALHSVPENMVGYALHLLEGMHIKGDVSFTKDVRKRPYYIESVEETFFTL